MGQDAEISICSAGVRIGDDVVPMLAGEVHYFRLDPTDWQPCLRAIKELGLRFVETPVPWGVHEIGGRFDFGASRSELDVRRFLTLARSLGLYVILRLGPELDSQLAHLSLPERVVWDEACQARSPQGHPVLEPSWVAACPLPGLAREGFLAELDTYWRAVGEHLAPVARERDGIVLADIGAAFERWGVARMYEIDHSDEAVAKYRQFLISKYGNLGELARAYELSLDTTLEAIHPPHRFSHRGPTVLYADWVDFRREVARHARERARAQLEFTGFAPLRLVGHGESVQAVSAEIGGGRATEATRLRILSQTTRAASRADTGALVPWGSGVQAGFAPSEGMRTDSDEAFCAMAALAYGGRGFGVRMAVERDRWLGAPIDVRGRRRPSADFWRPLCRAFEAVELHRLHRVLPVRLIVSASEQRHANARQAVSPFALEVGKWMGVNEPDLVIENNPGAASFTEATFQLSEVARALEEMGIAFGWGREEDGAETLQGAAWIVVAGSWSPADSLEAYLDAAARAGAAVTLVNGATPTATESLPQAGQRGGLPSGGIRRFVRDAASRLDLPRLHVAPNLVSGTLFVDDAGAARVLFLLNATTQEIASSVSLGADVREALDLMSEEVWKPVGSAFEIPVPPGAVRMLALG